MTVVVLNLNAAQERAVREALYQFTSNADDALNVDEPDEALAAQASAAQEVLDVLNNRLSALAC